MFRFLSDNVYIHIAIVLELYYVLFYPVEVEQAWIPVVLTLLL